MSDYMVDSSDGDFAIYGIGGIFGLILAIVLYFVACSNAQDCATRQCAAGAVPKVVDHDCVCVEHATKPD
jgi:hypothetical protein